MFDELMNKSFEVKDLFLEGAKAMVVSHVSLEVIFIALRLGLSWYLRE